MMFFLGNRMRGGNGEVTGDVAGGGIGVQGETRAFRQLQLDVAGGSSGGNFVGHFVEGERHIA